MTPLEYDLNYLAANHSEELLCLTSVQPWRAMSWMNRATAWMIGNPERWEAFNMDDNPVDGLESARDQFQFELNRGGGEPVTVDFLNPWDERLVTNLWEWPFDIPETTGTRERILAQHGVILAEEKLSLAGTAWRILASYQLFLRLQVRKLSGKGALLRP